MALTGGDGATLNIGSGHGTSVNQIFAALKAEIGSAPPPQFGPPRPGDVRNFWLDTTRAAEVLGWRPEVSFEDGIRETVAWYRARAKLPYAPGSGSVATEPVALDASRSLECLYWTV
jgi:UDP-glucose 4-epimerase